mgnify:CR=1 FL=1
MAFGYILSTNFCREPHLLYLMYLSAIIDKFINIYYAYKSVFWVCSIFALFLFLVSLISMPYFICLIPENYFKKPEHRRLSTFAKNPVIRIFLLILKNLLGLLLIISGIIMLFIPGQGILTILLGFLFIDFPGKFYLERKVILNKKVFNLLNKIRLKKGYPKLKR